jgi:hypothetical protein
MRIQQIKFAHDKSEQRKTSIKSFAEGGYIMPKQQVARKKQAEYRTRQFMPVRHAFFSINRCSESDQETA